MNRLLLALVGTAWFGLSAAAPEATAQFRFYYGGNQSQHNRYHDNLDHNEYHRQLNHRRYHRYPSTSWQHQNFHQYQNYNRYRDYLNHNQSHYRNPYTNSYWRGRYGYRY